VQLLELLWEGINLLVFGYFQLQEVLFPSGKGTDYDLWHYHSLSSPGQTTRFRVPLYLQFLYIAVWRSAQEVVYRFLEWIKLQGDYIGRIFKLPLTIFYEDLKEFGNKLLKVSLILSLDIRLKWKVWFTFRLFILGKCSVLRVLAKRRKTWGIHSSGIRCRVTGWLFSTFRENYLFSKRWGKLWVTRRHIPEERIPQQDHCGNLSQKISARPAHDSSVLTDSNFAMIRWDALSNFLRESLYFRSSRLLSTSPPDSVTWTLWCCCSSMALPLTPPRRICTRHYTSPARRARKR